MDIVSLFIDIHYVLVYVSYLIEVFGVLSAIWGKHIRHVCEYELSVYYRIIAFITSGGEIMHFIRIFRNT